MNHTKQTEQEAGDPKGNPGGNKRIHRGLATTFALGAIAFAGYLAFAQSAPQPALTITSQGSNQFSILITNGVASTNYELYWTPVLGDTLDFPWTLLSVGSPGQTNWTVDGSDWPISFFRVSIEQLYNGVPDYELADPNNPSLGPLSITIDSPTNGSNVN
jgi:hypothetical protein